MYQSATTQTLADMARSPGVQLTNPLERQKTLADLTM